MSTAACYGPRAWAGAAVWTLIDTDWRDGQHLQAAWQAWQADAQRPALLHYVAVVPSANWLDAITEPALRQALQHAHNPDAHSGFQRYWIAGGQVSLTVCIGSPAAMLAEQYTQAHAVICGPTPPDTPLIKQLARLCQRGTVAATGSPLDATQLAPWQAAGFAVDAHGVLRFDPRWPLRTSRQTRLTQPMPVQHALVLGAGLAGACVAHGLARRGWQVQVLDQHAQPAAGASGLPAGLVVPYVAADEAALSRISSNGITLMLQHARALLQAGHDWSPSGVTERRAPGNTAESWLHHPRGAWIKPARLVQALLQHPRITFTGGQTVHTIHRTDAQWTVHDAAGHPLATAPLLVLTNASGCAPLLHTLEKQHPLAPALASHYGRLQTVHGLLSYGEHAHCSAAQKHSLPATPVNGKGALLPAIPDANGALQWMVGATFEPQADALHDTAAQHAQNRDRLRYLLPDTAAAFEPLWHSPAVRAWTGSRCVSHDRMPLVGPVLADPAAGLWLCTGLGTRGLSFAALCAELLAAEIGIEPLPLELSLARSLDVRRPARGPSPRPL